MPKRTDDNQKDIVKTFRDFGYSVYILSMVGKGFPDIIVSKDGVNYLFEIKNDKRPPNAQKLTPAEQIFFDSWQGHVEIINSVQSVVQFVLKQAA